MQLRLDGFMAKVCCEASAPEGTSKANSRHISLIYKVSGLWVADDYPWENSCPMVSPLWRSFFASPKAWAEFVGQVEARVGWW
jgi:hypothetical protein